jgi:class 3 adenylate cyclase
MADPSSPDGLTPVTVHFVDMSGSTALYAQRGDAAAFGLTKECLDLVCAQVRAAGGRVLRLVGDGVLSVFESPAQALRAAIQINQVIDDPTCRLAREGIRVRSGISSGMGVLESDDVYGDVANVAARLISRAGAGEIFISGSVYDGLSDDLREQVQLIDEMLLRNRPEPVLVYRYIPDHQLATIKTPPRRASTATMEVTFGELLVVVGRQRPRITLGRDQQNDIRIEADVVSRTHAEIALSGDRFVLTDRSTNGTYVYADNGPMLRVVREELVLASAGRIFLGIEETARPIRYRVATP